MGNMGNLQQMAMRMQAELQKKQAQLLETEVTAQSGGGMVSCTVNGAHQIVRLTINPEAVDPDDVEMLEDTVTAAVNAAMHEFDEMAQKEMSALTGGLPFGR
ncbi:MAG: YbaB/EbfC family nucleoid-associated protein [Clostridia bacterium]|nr:YbaB/EbfC family nucleoid-associated protein [Clostridia bacterium]